MAYCGPRGIPDSHFLGGPLEWTASDRDKALAWQDQQARTHHVCGTRPEEWDPAQGGSRNAWVYEINVCPGCERLERAQKQMTGELRGERLVMRRPKPKT